jgi:sulfite reductase (NADPH) flavoprotein alpha-component
LDKEELIWLNGYLSGITKNEVLQEAPTALTTPAKSAVNKITIAYGTESGNSKKLATDFGVKAKKSGINAKVVSLDQYRLNDLAKEEYFFTIVSTQGEGDPPAGAKKFYDHIHNNGFQLKGLKYGVLALGDTSYPLFCKAGEDVDQQLNKLGGERIVPLQKCDTDYETDAESWFGQVLQQLTKDAGSGAATPATVVPAPKKTTGKKIYTGSVLTNINLNDIGSAKETHHIEIAADDVDYLPGDSFGIIPENPAEVVEAIVAQLNMDKERTYTFRNEDVTAYELFKKKLNIFYLPERVVAKYSALVGQDIPATKIGLLDLLKIYPLNNSDQFESLIQLLEPIAPRLYSISSSPEAHSGEVHLTVARDKFLVGNEWKYGLASDFLAGSPVDASLEFYIHKNNQFRLPEEERDVIMIGPGTGIAPFRSFLAQRMQRVPADAIGSFSATSILLPISCIKPNCKTGWKPACLQN